MSDSVVVDIPMQSMSNTVVEEEEDDDDDAVEPVQVKPKKAKYKHPYSVFFHMLFRSAALFNYLFFSLFYNSFVTNFILVVLCLSLDFWTVKNVTGRMLVGMRWWNQVDDDGNSKWVFECKKDKTGLSKRESKLFWYSLYIFCVIWIVFAFTALIGLQFQWLLIVLVAIAFNLANVIGYTKCERNAVKSVSSLAGNVTNILGSSVMSGAMSAVSSHLMNSVVSGGSETSK